MTMTTTESVNVTASSSTATSTTMTTEESTTLDSSTLNTTEWMEYNTTMSTTAIDESESTEGVVEDIQEISTTEQFASNLAHSQFGFDVLHFAAILFLSFFH